MIAAPMPQLEVVEPRYPGAAVLLDIEGEPLSGNGGAKTSQCGVRVEARDRQREHGHARQSRHRDHRAERLWKIDVHLRAQSHA